MPSADEPKSRAVTFRTRPRLRASLEKAASENGRSISEEIELRLERSFDREAVIMEALGGANAPLFRELYRILGWLEGPDEVIDSHYLAAITLILDWTEATISDLEQGAIFDLWVFLSMRGIMAINQGCDEPQAWDRALKKFPNLQKTSSLIQHLEQLQRELRRRTGKRQKKANS